MKKVKVMLTAITVLAVVGGALAFKAKTFNAVVYTTSDASGTNCPLRTPKFQLTTEAIGSQILVTDVAPTNAQGEPCVFTYTKANN